MAIQEHPAIGTLLTCNFDAGFKEPEMIGRRLVVVVSPKIKARWGLCSVIPLSLTAPYPAMPYHAQITFDPPLPDSWGNQPRWVKGDMITSVAYHRLDFVRLCKDRAGKRLYRMETLPPADMKVIQGCLLSSLGLAGLTRHLE